MSKRNILFVVVALLVFMLSISLIPGCKAAVQQEATGTTAAPKEDAAETTAAPKEEAKKEEIVLTFFSTRGGAMGEYYEKWAKEYSEMNPDVDIHLEQTSGDEYFTKLTAAFAAGSPPDVYEMSASFFLDYVNNGSAMDITQYYTPKLLDDFLASSIAGVTVGGKIYGIPTELDLLGLYYNVDMLKAANVEPPKTWDEWIAATKKLTTDKVAGCLIEPSKGAYQNFTWYPFMWMGGGEAIDKAAKKATFEGPAVENALQLWADLIKAGAPAQTPVGTWDFSMLGNEEAAMQLSGSWGCGLLEDNWPDVNIGVVPLPIPAGGSPKTDGGGWSMIVNSSTPYPKEAAEFAFWMFANEDDPSIPLIFNTVPKFAYSPRQSAVEAGMDDIYSKGLRKIFTEDIYPSMIPEPRYPGEIVNAIGDAIQDTMFGASSAKDAAARANERIQAYIDSYDGEF